MSTQAAPSSEAAQREEIVDTVVLDVDGTLVDTVYLHVDAWAVAFWSLGVVVPHRLIHRAIGMGADRLVAAVAGDDVERRLGDEIRGLHDEGFLRRLPEVNALPGAAEVLRALARRPVKVVVASSGSADQTDQLLEVVGERDTLHAVVSSADADATKPAPDLLEAAIDAADGSRALVVGDAVWDGRAGVRGGHRCVGLLSGGFAESDLRDAGASWVYDDPRDLAEHLDDVPLPAQARA